MTTKLTSELLDEIHPGEILLEDFMKPMNITARQLAADLDVPPSRISDIVNGNRPITADTALRLGLFLRWKSAFGSIYKRNMTYASLSAHCFHKLHPEFVCLT